MKKVVFSDIDRTLAIKKKVTKKNQEAINNFISLGNEFILVTGRSISYAKNIAKENNTSKYIICNNGSVIYDYVNDEIIYVDSIKYDLLLKLINITKEYDAKINICTISNDYTNKDIKHDQVLIDIDDKLLKDEIVTQAVIVHPSKGVIKQIINEINLMDEIKVNNICRKVYDESFIKHGELWIDVTASNVSKGNAIIKMLEYLNVELKDSIRIGDDLNDLPMFLDEGVNVAVKNAFPKLKEHADYITDSCENSGVGKVIDKILNNEL